MPPTCDRQWCIRQITRDARSAARGRTPEDQIAGAADHRSDRAVKRKPERHECDPSRHLLRGCTKFWQLTLIRRGVRYVHPTRSSFPSSRQRRFLSPSTTKGAHMFTRVVELISESGKAKELANTINEKVVPILKKQRGFVDETVLISDTEPTRILGLSFWNNKEDAERYHQEQYPKIHEMMKHLLETEPNIRTFDVHTSTTHRIVAGKAA